MVVGADGVVSLSALRWLSDQKFSFAMLDRNGTPLATTGPVCPSDARLRRAQALAHQSGAALEIARGLIDQKLVAQQELAQDGLCNQMAAEEISQAREALATARSVETIRLIESRAARSYWSSWRTLPINFPQKDLRRVPDHWRIFGMRFSSLTRTPRLAANPPMPCSTTSTHC